MKHIVYLDTDFLNSYIAQIHEGIPKNISSESGQSRTFTDGEKASTAVETTIEGGIDFRLAAAKSKVSAILGPNEEYNELSHSEYARELLEKVLHDNALDLLVGYLANEGVLKNSFDDTTVGDFVSCSFPLEVFDLEFMSDLFSDKTLNLIAELSSFEEIDKMDSDANRKGESSSTKTKNRLILANIASMTNNGRTPKTISALKAISPYSRFLYTQGAIIPLKSQYLRESLAEIDFKYGGSVHLVGRTTRDGNTKKESAALAGAFSNMSDLTFDTATSLYKGGQRRVVTPIALFFE